MKIFIAEINFSARRSFRQHFIQRRTIKAKFRIKNKTISADHIARLKDQLNRDSPNYEMPQQHLNLKALIELYETGQRTTDEEEILIMGGKVVTKDIARKTGDWVLIEVRIYLNALIKNASSHNL